MQTLTSTEGNNTGKWWQHLIPKPKDPNLQLSSVSLRERFLTVIKVASIVHKSLCYYFCFSWTVDILWGSHEQMNTRLIFQKGKKGCFSMWSRLLLFNSLSRVRLWDRMDCGMPGFPILHHLTELALTHVHQVSDAIQPPHPLPSLSLPASHLSQHQRLF